MTYLALGIVIGWLARAVWKRQAEAGAYCEGVNDAFNAVEAGIRDAEDPELTAIREAAPWN